MLSTYTRLMDAARVMRYGGRVTYDNRALSELVRQLQSEVDALRAHVRKLEGDRS